MIEWNTLFKVLIKWKSSLEIFDEIGNELLHPHLRMNENTICWSKHRNRLFLQESLYKYTEKSKQVFLNYSRNFKVLGFQSATKVRITSELYHNQFKKNQCTFLNQDLQKRIKFGTASTSSSCFFSFILFLTHPEGCLEG